MIKTNHLPSRRHSPACPRSIQAVRSNQRQVSICDSAEPTTQQRSISPPQLRATVVIRLSALAHRKAWLEQTPPCPPVTARNRASSHTRSPSPRRSGISHSHIRAPRLRRQPRLQRRETSSHGGRVLRARRTKRLKVYTSRLSLNLPFSLNLPLSLSLSCASLSRAQVLPSGSEAISVQRIVQLQRGSLRILCILVNKARANRLKQNHQLAFLVYLCDKVLHMRTLRYPWLMQKGTAIFTDTCQ